METIAQIIKNSKQKFESWEISRQELPYLSEAQKLLSWDK